MNIQVCTIAILGSTRKLKQRDSLNKDVPHGITIFMGFAITRLSAIQRMDMRSFNYVTRETNFGSSPSNGFYSMVEARFYSCESHENRE